MEDERRIEQSKVTVRWIVTAVLLAGAAYLRRGGAIGTPWTVILALTAGVARRLLDAVCEGFRREGLAVAEAYPLKESASDARAYHGPLAMYLAAGFNPYREGKKFVVVRKSMVDGHVSP